VDESTWRARTEVPLVVAGFAYLVAYSWRVIADLTGPARIVATTVVLVTWGIFIVDYLVRLFMADRRWVWFRTHLSDLAFALVPVLRLVRLLRFLTLLPGLRSTRGDRLRTQIMVYGAGAAVILIYIASLAVLEAERHAPGANITTFGIAFWWACVTVTTTGFGDYTPITDAGRLVGIGVMFGGVALAGIITATLASLVVELASRGHDDREPATRAQVRELLAKVEALTAASARPDPARDAGTPGGSGLSGDPRAPRGEVLDPDAEGHGGDDRPGG
jgi:voltage-gated potassium channel